jgi:tetratricopeptide (TPR) repeat protein
MTATTARSGRDATRRLLADGLVHHRAGRLAEAAACYRRVLVAAPLDADANHLAGLLALGRGDVADAAAHFTRSVRARPTVAEYRSNLGHALRTLGDLPGAEATLVEAIRLEPGFVDGWINLGLVRLDQGDLPAAITALEEATAHQPTAALAWLNLGSARQRASRLPEALDAFAEAARLAPDLAPAWRNLAIVAHQLGRIDDAVLAYRRVVALMPTDGDGWSQLGALLLRAGRLDESLAVHDAAVRVGAHLGDAWLNRGTANQAAGRLEEARASFERAVGLGESAEAWTALGSLAAETGDFPEAARCHRRALALRPDFGDAHWNLALALLGGGDLAAGWDEYEWRWEASNRPMARRSAPPPFWRGEPVAGRRLLVWREQGLGDEVLFLTCLGDLVSAGAQVTVQVSPRLVGLVARTFPTVKVVDDPAAAAAGPGYDWQVPMGSLPRWLRRDLTAFGERPPLVRPLGAQAAKWRERLAALPPGRRVGVCWRSGLMTPERRRHYPPLPAWGPVWRVPDVTWVNLQYDDCAADLTAIEAGHGMRIHRWDGEDLKDDLESVVGLLASLDGVVTAPTAVGSFAGAVGVPTWQVDSGSDWTSLGLDHSPWFPRMARVKKGSGPGGWNVAMVELAARLGGWVPEGAGGRDG